MTTLGLKNFGSLSAPIQPLSEFDDILGNESSATQGAGLLGYSSANAYAAGSVGFALNTIAEAIIGFVTLTQLAASSGASLIGFINLPTSSVSRTAQSKMRETRSVLDFGALGNSNGTTGNGSDDSTAISLGDAYLSANGGGTLRFPWTGVGGWRTTIGLKRSANVTWEFEGIQGYPFASGALTNCIWADFTNANQWVVDTNTLISGSPIAYNTILTTFPTGTATYNSGLINCYIRVPSGAAVMPFGGIRSVGTGNDRVINCSVTGVGCAGLANEAIGGVFECHSITPYYGFAAWNDCNANTFRIYATQGTTNPTTVPTAYQLPFMTALNGALTTAPYHLSTNAHYNAPFGFILGAAGTFSVSNLVELTVESFTEQLLLLNARSAVFTRSYLEASTSQTTYGLVAASSTFEIKGLHAFLSGTGTLFDFGAALTGCQITANGINTYAAFGTVYADGTPDGSLVQIKGFTASQMLYSGNYRSIQFLSDNQNFSTPSLSGTWANVGAPFQNAGYRKNQFSGNVELCGFIQSGSTGSAVFTLPVGYRPSFQRAFPAFGNGSGTLPNVIVTAAGVVMPSYAGTAGTNISLDGINFRAEQ